MEQSEDIARLLTEIRDLHREHFAEYKRATENWERANNGAAEQAAAQYKESVKSSQSFTWAMWILIAVCLGANLFMMVRVTALK